MFYEKKMFYAKLDSILEQCPIQDTLIVLYDFNAIIGTETAAYELCVGHVEHQQFSPG